MIRNDPNEFCSRTLIQVHLLPHVLEQVISEHETFERNKKYFTNSEQIGEKNDKCIKSNA